MSDPGQPDRARVARALLLGSGALFGLAALALAPGLLETLFGRAPTPLVREKLQAVRLGFAATALALAAASEGVWRLAALRRLVSRPAVTTALLALAGLLVPLALVDFSLRPFVEPKTVIFTEDAQLGWRLAPGAEGEWGGVRVRINAKGLRGPEVDYARRPGVARILWLGDSVTFGYRIARSSDTFPYLTGAELERRLGRPVETVDAGVGGWSPWQELRWYRREGVRYAPDVVVVGFVLNDVTEKLALTRFGGAWQGWQLARTARSTLEYWLSGSAVVSLLRGGVGRWRFGRDVAAGARRAEGAQVRWLMSDPPELEGAWALTLGNLERLFATARRRRTPGVLVVFPYAFQLDRAEATASPQRRLAAWARAHHVPCLDLLPALADGEGAQDRWFLDASHLSEAGHRRVAQRLADFLAARGLPARAGAP
jgi:GDSL-like Lipase/Acylhydrolase family